MKRIYMAVCLGIVSTTLYALEMRYYEPTLSEELESIGKQYEGAHELPLEHMFTLQRAGGGLSGLHHDFQGYLEESDVIILENKYEDKDGYYCGALYVKKVQSIGEQLNFVGFKSFFPKKWSREKVVATVLKALHTWETTGSNLKLYVAKPRNGSRVVLVMEDGHQLQLRFDERGRMTTVHPLVNKRHNSLYTH